MNSLEKIATPRFVKESFGLPKEIEPNAHSVGNFHKRLHKLATRIVTLSFSYFSFFYPATAAASTLNSIRNQITNAYSLQDKTEIGRNVIELGEAIVKSQEKGIRSSLNELIKKTSTVLSDFGYVSSWFLASITASFLEIHKTFSHYSSNKKIEKKYKLEQFSEKNRIKLINSTISLSRTLVFFGLMSLETAALFVAAPVLKVLGLAATTAFFALDIFSHHLDKKEIDPKKNFHIYRKLPQSQELLYTL